MREWCGAEAVHQFAELTDLRAEVARIGAILDEALQKMEDRGLTREVGHLQRLRGRF